MKQWKHAFSFVLAMLLMVALMPTTTNAVNFNVEIITEPTLDINFGMHGDIEAIFSEGLSPFAEGEIGNYKWGYMDTDGEIAIPIQYDYAGHFYEGLAEVGLKDENGFFKWGFIDKTGEIVIPIEYDQIAPQFDYYGKGVFREGLALVRKGEEISYIDKIGNTVLSVDFDGVWPFKDGIARVGYKDPNNFTSSYSEDWIGTADIFGYIDMTGNIVIPIQYYSISEISDGLILVTDTNNKSGFIDKTGNIVIPLEYERAYDFKENLARVFKNGKYGFINKSGEVIIPFEYDNSYDFKDGYASVTKDGKWGLIGKTGNIVVPFEYDSIILYEKGFVRLTKNNETIYSKINNMGNLENLNYEIVRGSRESAFTEGLASVRKSIETGYKYGFIDTLGNVVVPFEYDSSDNYFSGGFAPIVKNGKWGIIDTSNNIVLPFEYDWISHFNDGIAIIQKDGKYGIIKAVETPTPTPPSPVIPIPPVNNSEDVKETEKPKEESKLEEKAPTIDFKDIKETDWFYDAVSFVVDYGLFTGYDDATFAPHDNMTRAMFVTVLGRLAESMGIFTKGNDVFFNDVNNGQWYSEYVAWAVTAGILNGYNSSAFGTNDNITREQLSVMLIRFVSYADLYLEKSDTVIFADNDSISGWATDAIKTVAEAGLMTGFEDGTFRPQETATRAEIATIFMRFIDKYIK